MPKAKEVKPQTDFGEEVDNVPDEYSDYLSLDANDIADAKPAVAAPEGRYKLRIARAIPGLVGADKKYTGAKRITFSFKIVGGENFNDDTFYKRVQAWLVMPDANYRNLETGETMTGESLNTFKVDLQNICGSCKIPLKEAATALNKVQFASKTPVDIDLFVGKEFFAKLSQRTQAGFGTQNMIDSYM